ncbi:MAG TPA: alkaline phosphatase [Methylococcaceae bacterium]|nr:alkaline phosphatase [Methylococcaceae bacterium]
MYNKESKITSGAMLVIGSLLSLSNTANATNAADVETPKFWIDAGQKSLTDADNTVNNKKTAKNVILFVGDGMGISTITASRIFEGQQKAGNRGGEENSLSFEQFPHVALSKTYSVNQQTSDSAPTMAAMMTGVKTNDGELSVGASVVRQEKDAAVIDANKTITLLEQAELKGLSTGIVTTARLTHATPAACYAHTSERNWESDADILKDVPTGATVKDIASQLVNFNVGNGLEVALGGGRSYFMPNTMADPEDTTKKGLRKDGVDLTAQWQAKYKNSAFVYDKAGWDKIDVKNTDHLLGLFESTNHMEYEADRARDTGGEPSLTEMTEKAIQILSKNKKGYFLMVEGGRIDHAHHAGNAYRALTETVELSNAVRKAVQMTDSAANDTLIIVTADHSHTFTIAGYPQRGNPILGLVTSPGKTTPDLAADGKPYATLSYANGGGYRGGTVAAPTSRPTLTASATIAPTTSVPASADLSILDTMHPNFMQEAAVPMAYGAETHAAEDVGIFAKGPRAYLFHGVQEQSYIYQVMAKALGIKPTVYSK